MSKSNEIDDGPYDKFEEKVLVKRERLLSFGVGVYENEKLSTAMPTLSDPRHQKKAFAALCHLLNVEELKARRNHEQMKRIWAEEQKELARQQQLKDDDVRREKMMHALQRIKAYPHVSQSELAKALELTLYEIGDIISDLVDEGKLRRRECRRLFDIVE